MTDLTPALLRQLREIASEWDHRPDADAGLLGRRRHVGGLFRGGDVRARAGSAAAQRQA